MKGLRNRYNLSLSFPGPLVSDCAPTLSLNGLLDSHYLPDNLACSGPGRNLKLTISLMCYRVVRFKGESTEHPDTFVTLCDPMDCNRPGSLNFTIFLSLLKHAHWIDDASNHLILCHPLLFLTSIIPNIRVFSNECAVCICWSKYWSFSFIISPSNEYLGLMSFRVDWFDLLVVQGILKSLLQHHSSKASVLWYSAFFMVQLLHSYMTTGKTIVLSIQTFVDKVMSAFWYT